MFSSDSTQVSSAANYIEDVFSTYLYQANGSTQTITNGIDLAGKGGLVWIKSRSNATGNVLVDTVRGSPYVIQSNNTNAQGNWTDEFGSFSSTGFTVPYNTIYGETNFQTRTYASWTFRKQPKFFDVVTWTGDGADTRYIFHSLTGTTGCVIAKRTDSSGNWIVGHRSITSGGENLLLNSTSAKNGNYGTIHNLDAYSGTAFGVYNGFGSTDPTNYLNVNGATYVAYVFAHNAGGFGLTGTDNVISCGSFTTDGSGNATVSLGYEPQWVLIKSSSNADGWQMVDTMRGMAVSNGLYNGDQVLQSQASSAETSGAFVQPSATGFDITYYGSSRTYIYIAIRRGPMKVPTSGTSVFKPVAYSGDDSALQTITTGFPIDMQMLTLRNEDQTTGSTNSTKNTISRLTGLNTTSTNTDYTRGLFTSATTAETNILGYLNFLQNTFGVTTLGGKNTGGRNYITWNFKRAPNFFDVVCYTGDGTDNRQITHNLGVAPELIINKNRGVAWPWWVGGSVLGSTSNGMFFNTTGAIQDNPAPKPFSTNGSAFTSNYFLVSSVAAYPPNASGYSNIAYLFSTLVGVSKVGTYTGNGATQTINCGFTSGARFVLIKRTDSGGSWYIFDTARGMTTSTDPYLATNNTAAEIAASGAVTTVATGFALDGTLGTPINTDTATYIFLAIA